MAWVNQPMYLGSCTALVVHSKSEFLHNPRASISPSKCFFHASLAWIADLKKTNVAFISAQVQNGPMNNNQESQIANDGLRYKNKESGSPFKDSANMSSISCYKCGVHKPRALGVFKMMINQRMFMCGDCMPQKSE